MTSSPSSCDLIIYTNQHAGDDFCYYYHKWRQYQVLLVAIIASSRIIAVAQFITVIDHACTQLNDHSWISWISLLGSLGSLGNSSSSQSSSGISCLSLRPSMRPQSSWQSFSMKHRSAGVKWLQSNQLVKQVQMGGSDFSQLMSNPAQKSMRGRLAEGANPPPSPSSQAMAFSRRAKRRKRRRWRVALRLRSMRTQGRRLREQRKRVAKERAKESRGKKRVAVRDRDIKQWNTSITNIVFRKKPAYSSISNGSIGCTIFTRMQYAPKARTSGKPTFATMKKKRILIVPARLWRQRRQIRVRNWRAHPYSLARQRSPTTRKAVQKAMTAYLTSSPMKTLAKRSTMSTSSAYMVLRIKEGTESRLRQLKKLRVKTRIESSQAKKKLRNISSISLQLSVMFRAARQLWKSPRSWMQEARKETMRISLTCRSVWKQQAKVGSLRGMGGSKMRSQLILWCSRYSGDFELIYTSCWFLTANIIGKFAAVWAVVQFSATDPLSSFPSRKSRKVPSSKKAYYLLISS